jgi:multimeric flavodoxin WrbA
VQVYRIKDPIHGDDTSKFDAAVLAAPIVTREHLLDADCIIIGAPGRQGGFAGEVRLFLDSMAVFQRPARQGNTSQLMVRQRQQHSPTPVLLARARHTVSPAT